MIIDEKYKFQLKDNLTIESEKLSNQSIETVCNRKVLLEKNRNDSDSKSKLHLKTSIKSQLNSNKLNRH